MSKRSNESSAECVVL